MTKRSGKVIAVQGDPKKYASLLSTALPAIIETEEQNERYLAIVEDLMSKGENLSPEEETLLNLLAHLIEDFERRYYKPRKAKPLEVLHELMAANDLKQADLVPIFGSKGITSEVVNGKRGISKAHARALAEYFHVAPGVFI
ncbi:MAG: helix-turn-helix domain-containing protein [Blastocatellia bacterium]